MDYSELSREVIYKDRTDLKEFGVLIPGTLNHYLFNQMRRLTLLHCGNAKEIALKCFNNAYYICTLTQLDEFPDMCVDKYEKKLLSEKIPFVEDVYQASMALVCVLLGAYDVKYKQKDNYLIESIHRATSSNKWVGSYFHKSFEDVINSCNPDGFCIVDGEFEPRDICEAIETVSVGVLESSAEYVCERLALLNDSRRKKYGADLALARLKGDLREIYEGYDYDPKKKIYKGDPHYKESFWKEVDPLKAAIDYYTKHYPKRKEVDASNTIMQESSKIDNASHENDIKNLQAQIKGKDFEIAKLKEQLAATNNTIDHQNTQIANLNAQIEELQQKLKNGEESQGWIDWLDSDVFDSSINVKEIYKLVNNTSAPNLIDRPRCYVLYRVLDVIKALKKNAHQKDILKWWNAHFECGWNNDNQFKFTNIPQNILSSQISEWKNCKGNNNQYYYEYSQQLLSALAWNKGRGEYEIKKPFKK